MMPDASTVGVPLLTGSLVLVSLFIAWYRRVDPLVSFHLALLRMRRPAYIRLISLARCYSSSRV